MRSPIIASVAVAAVFQGVQAQTNSTPVTGILGNAAPVLNNPVGPVYTAVTPQTQFFNPSDPRGNIKATVQAKAASGGQGVQFDIQVSNLPTSGGPFLYHLHAFPVNSSGSCASTLAHLDPYLRGEQPKCNPADGLNTCQVGDLSGKYGNITSDPFTASFVDLYASIVPGLGSFFPNRSITFHFANTTRITCANFTLASGSATNSSGNSSATTTSSMPKFTGGANGVVASVGVLAAGLAFAAFL